METGPLLLGHRGARFDKTVLENTLAAFDFALAQGCDGFEFDVRLTADGQAVICHDEIVRPQRWKIAARPARDLRRPTLEEVLSRYKDAAFLDIELKVQGLEKTTAALLKQYPPARGFVVSSFLPEVLKKVRDLDPAVPLGLICETREQFARWRELPVDYVIPHYGLVTQQLVSELKAAEKKILVWTVNLPSEMERLARWGVNGIVSDHPAQLAATFGRLLKKR